MKQPETKDKMAVVRTHVSIIVLNVKDSNHKSKGSQWLHGLNNMTQLYAAFGNPISASKIQPRIEEVEDDTPNKW